MNNLMERMRRLENGSMRPLAFEGTSAAGDDERSLAIGAFEGTKGVWTRIRKGKRRIYKQCIFFHKNKTVVEVKSFSYAGYSAREQLLGPKFPMVRGETTWSIRCDKRLNISNEREHRAAHYVGVKGGGQMIARIHATIEDRIFWGRQGDIIGVSVKFGTNGGNKGLIRFFVNKQVVLSHSFEIGRCEYQLIISLCNTCHQIYTILN